MRKSGGQSCQLSAAPLRRCDRVLGVAVRQNHEPSRFNANREFDAGRIGNAGQRVNALCRLLDIHRKRQKNLPLRAQPVINFPSRPAAALDEFVVGAPSYGIVGIEKAIREVVQRNAFPRRGRRSHGRLLRRCPPKIRKWRKAVALHRSSRFTARFTAPRIKDQLISRLEITPNTLMLTILDPFQLFDQRKHAKKQIRLDGKRFCSDDPRSGCRFPSLRHVVVPSRCALGMHGNAAANFGERLLVALAEKGLRFRFEHAGV